MKLLRFLFLVLPVVFRSAQALYESNGDVIILTSKNFDELVLQDDAVWIVEFYAPWCIHSVNLVPEYKNAAKALKGVVKVGAVNDDDIENISLGDQYHIKSYPTIKIFGSNKSSPTDFYQRTAQEIVKAGLAEVKKNINGSNGYPTTKLLTGGRNSTSDTEDYNGVRTSSNIDSWALDKYSYILSLHTLLLINIILLLCI